MMILCIRATDAPAESPTVVAHTPGENMSVPYGTTTQLAGDGWFVHCSALFDNGWITVAVDAHNVAALQFSAVDAFGNSVIIPEARNVITVGVPLVEGPVDVMARVLSSLATGTIPVMSPAEIELAPVAFSAINAIVEGLDGAALIQALTAERDDLLVRVAYLQALADTPPTVKEAPVLPLIGATSTLAYLVGRSAGRTSHESG